MTAALLEKRHNMDQNGLADSIANPVKRSKMISEQDLKACCDIDYSILVPYFVQICVHVLGHIRSISIYIYNRYQ